MKQNELCFVWGTPLTGQRRWVAKTIEEAEGNAKNRVFFFEEFTTDAEFQIQLGHLGRCLDELSPNHVHHLYCLMPWNIVDFGLELEEWFTKSKRFGDWQKNEAGAAWGITFVGLCPFTAEALPREYREGLEEFSRSSRSDIIVVTPEENIDPNWLGSDILDFGQSIEVFEEQLWSGEIDQSSKHFVFTESSTFQTVLIPLHLNESKFAPLALELLRGVYGRLWNAEISWRGTDGNVHFLTTQDSRIYAWKTAQPEFRQLVPENCALLEICGQDLKSDEIKRLQDPKSFN